MLPATVQTVAVKQPNLVQGFEALRLNSESVPKSQSAIENVCHQIVRMLKVRGKRGGRLQTPLELLAYAGYYAGSADPTQIAPDEFAANRVVFATANRSCPHFIVKNRAKRAIVDVLLLENGFKRLLPVRFVDRDTGWKDFRSDHHAPSASVADDDGAPAAEPVDT